MPECVVVGAGVVGLAIARAIAARGMDTVVLERHGAIGTETSSRSSEVIHAGIYYPQGSLKASLCVTGRKLLYAYCSHQGVPHRRCGKLIVATSTRQLRKLDAIAAAAALNGVDDLERLTRARALALEPALDCLGALYSPSTGILDSHALMLALHGDAERHGAVIACRNTVTSARPVTRGIEFGCAESPGETLQARWLINSAGLNAVALAARIEGLPRETLPRAYVAKGNYFSLAGRAPFSRLVYPVPEPGGLGVHLTLDLTGRARFGPDVQWIESTDYNVDPGRLHAFYGAIRRYWPGLPDGSLAPDYAGLRPKISGPSEPSADFRIDGPDVHGIPGVINLFGIESPGLTASLAIAERVAEIIGRD